MQTIWLDNAMLTLEYILLLLGVQVFEFVSFFFFLQVDMLKLCKSAFVSAVTIPIFY